MGIGDHNARGLPCDGLASHPGGSSNIPNRFMLWKPELSTGLMGLLACKQTLPLPFFMCRPTGSYFWDSNLNQGIMFKPFSRMGYNISNARKLQNIIGDFNSRMGY